MIRIHILSDEYDDLNFYISRYVNDNLNCIIRVLIDLTNDGFPISSIFPCNNFSITEDEWLDHLHTLFDITTSDVIRDYIKPKYEYLLYYIIRWWENTQDDSEERDFIPYPINEETDLTDRINQSSLHPKERKSLIRTLSDYQNYYSFCFYDHDFLTDNISNFVIIYLRNESLFNLLFDVDLQEYRDLMPKDLRELFDEKNFNLQNVERQEISFERLLSDIFWCCERIQANNSLKNSAEDDINSFLRDLLNALSQGVYIAKDQTRQGTSSNGINSGEVDILLEKNNMPFSLIEALKLDCVNKGYISTHINKIYTYDTLGYDYNFIISYVKCNDFSDFWNKYLNYVENYEYPYTKNFFNKEISLIRQYSEIKTAETILNRNGNITRLVHIAIHLLP